MPIDIIAKTKSRPNSGKDQQFGPVAATVTVSPKGMAAKLISAKKQRCKRRDGVEEPVARCGTKSSLKKHLQRIGENMESPKALNPKISRAIGAEPVRMTADCFRSCQVRKEVRRGWHSRRSALDQREENLVPHSVRAPLTSANCPVLPTVSMSCRRTAPTFSPIS